MSTPRKFLALFLCVALPTAGLADSQAGASQDSPASRPGDPLGADEYLVGVYYFAGWWRPLPNKYQTAGRDWRPDWPERKALLGEYNDQETMDREIHTAAECGVDFFQILWYYQGIQPPPEPHAGRLNDAIAQFMASPNNRRLKFMIEGVNHPPFVIKSEQGWVDSCREWVTAMKHPSYLRVAGRPVIKVHSLHQFLADCDMQPDRAARRLSVLRRLSVEAGLGDPIIGAGVVPAGMPLASQVIGFDFLSSYMDMPHLAQRADLYPYEQLIDHAAAAWERYAAHSPLPYVPYVPAGWDPRPWRDPRASFKLPDRAQWTKALTRVKSALDQHARLGLPELEGRRPKMLVIYAWNEFAEGGIVAPTQGDGRMKLEALRNVFGSSIASPER